MSRSTRCKFRCASVTPEADGFYICLYPVTGGSTENDQFFQYTPAGRLDLSIVNPDAAQMFEPGKTYYIDISEVTE